MSAAALGGGWPWALIASIVLAMLWRTDFRAPIVLGTVLPGLCWIALYQWTGDRRFFFPYAMQYAAQMAATTTGPPVLREIAGSGSIVLVFALIRIAQSAGARVLLVEIVVASAVIALPRASIGGHSPREP